jgi:hypothetical protein
MGQQIATSYLLLAAAVITDFCQYHCCLVFVSRYATKKNAHHYAVECMPLFSNYMMMKVMLSQTVEYQHIIILRPAN